MLNRTLPPFGYANVFEILASANLRAQICGFTLSNRKRATFQNQLPTDYAQEFYTNELHFAAYLRKL